MFLPLCEWLARTPWSIALHESLYLYPVVETTHVLALLLFVGTVLFLDLRLLGWVFDEVPVSEVVARLVPWALAGFAIFCLLASTIYIINDLSDLEAARRHPRKNLRPLASGVA